MMRRIIVALAMGLPLLSYASESKVVVKNGMTFDSVLVKITDISRDDNPQIKFHEELYPGRMGKHLSEKTVELVPHKPVRISTYMTDEARVHKNYQYVGSVVLPSIEDINTIVIFANSLHTKTADGHKTTYKLEKLKR